jgi:Na+/proline symporter
MQMSEQPEHVKLGLSWIDITIVAVYLVIIVIVGLLSGKLQAFIQRRSRTVKPPTNDHQELNDEETNATQTDVPPETTDTQENAPVEEPKMNEVDEYFLGSRSIPWWALAASGMASNLDVSGTMINCAMIYALGVRGMLIEMRGGLTLALAFLMAFLGKWHRRSGVMTPAEWMILRFGEGRQGDVARLSTAITSILYSIGHITYFAVGSGIFMAEFFDIPDLIGIRREFWAAIIMTTLSMIYTVATGLSGVVWTDVFQGFTIFAAIVIVCIKAMVTVTLPTTFQISSLLYNGTSVIQTTTWSDWSSPLPVWKLDFDSNSQYSVYNMFGIAIMLYASKLLLEGFGGPTGYAAQRYFAAKDEKDAARMTGLWIFLLSFRWPFIVAVCMLGIYFGNGYGGQVIPDPEIVLPRVIASMLPVGVKGIVVAAMISAAMSTFDSTVNAAAAIVVKDVYHAYIHKNATQKVLILVGRVSSIVLVCIAMLFMLAIKYVFVTIFNQ